MQGKKHYQEKIFTSFQLSEHIPENNFYRRLKEALDLGFLYNSTQSYYGKCGQDSIDPVVFYKLCLVGYLENITGDRRLIEHSKMRLDILYFLGYDIDEPLPWHSTISRTRQLFPEAIFEQVFNKILEMCISKGMVSGKIQTIDSAPVKANASIDSLELKVPAEELDEHIRKVRYMSTPDRKAKKNKAPKHQKTITASERELKEIKSRKFSGGIKNGTMTRMNAPGQNITRPNTPAIKPTIAPPIRMQEYLLNQVKQENSTT